MAAKTTAVARLATGNQIKIETVAELMALSDVLFKGGAGNMPNVDRPEKVARIILAGQEVGLSPAQAIDNIMLSKQGKTSIWGDAAIGLVLASGLLEKHREWVDGEGESRTGHCVVKRVGFDEVHSTFTIADANRAGLIERAKGKMGDGPWITYQDRQLKMRARGFALRDTFADVLKGLVTTEEMLDYPENVQTAEVKVVGMKADTPALPPAASPATATTPTNPGGLTAAEQAKLATAAAGAVEPEQLSLISDIRVSFFNAKALTNADEQRAAWVELLGGYGVKSAREFTSAKAAEFINTEGPKHDPFRFPPDGSSKT